MNKNISKKRTLRIFHSILNILNSCSSNIYSKILQIAKPLKSNTIHQQNHPPTKHPNSKFQTNPEEKTSKLQKHPNNNILQNIETFQTARTS